MKNNYVFILNDKGERITSIVDNKVKKEELIKQAKEAFPEATEYIYKEDGDKILDKFMEGFIYINGEMVKPKEKELTIAEQKKNKIEAIKRKYESKFAKYEVALGRAILANNEIAVQKLKDNYQAELKAMALEIKEV